jgi:hypothetical protein
MVRVACAVAGELDVEAVPKTTTGLPSAEPLFNSCIVPVGATPLLVVATVAVTESCVPASVDAGTPLIEVEVGAAEIVTFRELEALPV